PAEQIAIARRAEQLVDGPLQCDTAVTEQSAREYSFGAAELRLCQALLRPGHGEVISSRGPQASRLCRASSDRAAAERSRQGQRVEQRVALEDMPVEIRKRRDGGKVGIFIVRDQGEPESQFRKPHGGRREIDAKQRVGENVALDGGGGPVAGGTSERRQFVERSQQEGARSDGGVEDGEPAQVRSRSRWDAVMHPSRGGRRAQAKTIGEC